MTSNWLAFWDSSHSIYVNARHKDVHYRVIAEEIAALVPGRAARVLDYGCGEALHADLVAAAAAELLLCEGAPGVRAGLAARFAGHAKIRVLAPDDLAGLPEHALDLVVLHSVAQYLTPAEADALFAQFHRLLKPDGMLVVSDIIPPEIPAATDAAGAVAVRRGPRILLRGVLWSRADTAVGLLAHTLALRSHPLRRSRHDPKTRRRRVCGAPRSDQYRP